MTDQDAYRIAALEVDDASLAATTADAEHERRVAIFDLLESNSFRVPDAGPGPYDLRLAAADNRLIFDVRDLQRAQLRTIVLSLSPFRRVIRDYLLICESYVNAIRSATPSQIEAVDMGRRGLHNEGSELLRERLKDKAELDLETARRLFTLICALHRPR